LKVVVAAGFSLRLIGNLGIVNQKNLCVLCAFARKKKKIF
jgi:hypothetical protein